MAYDKTTDMQTLTVSAALLQSQNNFISIKDEALSLDGIKTFTASPIIPAPTTDLQAATKKYVDDLIQALYPVGSVYCNKAVATNPATLLGFGTWVAIGGKVLVGLDGTTEFATLAQTGGTKTHTLITAEMPAHTHTGNSGEADRYGTIPAAGDDTNVLNTYTAASAGGGGAHNNLQPYVVVYMWERTA